MERARRKDGLAATASVMLDAGEGPAVEALGGRCAIRIARADTGGAMAMLEVRVPPGDGAPLRLHRREDEAFDVVEGRSRFWCGDRSRTGAEGASVLLPRGPAHTFRTIGGTPGRLLLAITPGSRRRRPALRCARPAPGRGVGKVAAPAVESGLETIGPPPWIEAGPAGPAVSAG